MLIPSCFHGLIKDTKKYPFLGSPPMDEDLLKSKTNLSLIVGHNGGHKNTYNRLLDEKLKYIKDSLEQQCMKQNISFEALMQGNNVKSWINEEIEKTIVVLQDAVKKDHKIMNDVEKMFILNKY